MEAVLFLFSVQKISEFFPFSSLVSESKAKSLKVSCQKFHLHSSLLHCITEMLQLDKIEIMDAPATLDLKTFFRHFLSPRANGGIRTHDQSIMSKVFYHCTIEL